MFNELCFTKRNVYRWIFFEFYWDHYIVVVVDDDELIQTLEIMMNKK